MYTLHKLHDASSIPKRDEPNTGGMGHKRWPASFVTGRYHLVGRGYAAR
jgi:hypothetical protein